MGHSKYGVQNQKIKRKMNTNIKIYNRLKFNTYINVPPFTKRGIERFKYFIEELLEDLNYDTDPDECKYLDYLYTKCGNLLYYLENLDDLNEKLTDLNYTLYLDNFQY